MTDQTELLEICYKKGTLINQLSDDGDYVQLRVMLNNIISMVNTLTILGDDHTERAEAIVARIQEQLELFDKKYLVALLRNN